jgi:hypothetical protein
MPDAFSDPRSAAILDIVATETGVARAALDDAGLEDAKSRAVFARPGEQAGVIRPSPATASRSLPASPRRAGWTTDTEARRRVRGPGLRVVSEPDLPAPFPLQDPGAISAGTDNSVPHAMRARPCSGLLGPRGGAEQCPNISFKPHKAKT